MSKNLVWDEERTKQLVELYQKKGIKDIHVLGRLLDRKARSVAYKLGELGIRESSEKQKIEKITIPILIQEIEELLGIKIEGTTIYNKTNLMRITKAIEDLKAGK